MINHQADAIVRIRTALKLAQDPAEQDDQGRNRTIAFLNLAIEALTEAKKRVTFAELPIGTRFHWRGSAVHCTKIEELAYTTFAFRDERPYRHEVPVGATTPVEVLR